MDPQLNPINIQPSGGSCDTTRVDVPNFSPGQRTLVRSDYIWPHKREVKGQRSLELPVTEGYKS